MTNTALKNPPDSMKSAVGLAKSAIESAMKATVTAEEKPFSAQYGTCDVHGQYPLNMLDNQGRERWYPTGCPACRKQKEGERLLAASNIPKRFVGCEFSNYEALTDDQQRVLRRCESYANEFARYRDLGACLLLCGRPGTGKNHLATAISRKVLADGFTVLRIKASQYLDAYWAKSFDEREAWLRGIASVDLLILDEIGRSSQAKAAQDAFFRLLDSRYESQLPNLLATNLNRDELIEVLGEATYDRLTQGGSVRLTLDWESYRSKAKQGAA